MKIKKNKLVKTSTLKPDKNQVDELMSNWQKCLTTELSNLFTQVTPQGVKRVMKFELNSASIPSLIELNINSNVNNIKSISIILGNKDAINISSNVDATINKFIPILEVTLKEKVKNEIVYYFFLDPLNNQGSFQHLDIGQQISPKVAELFIFKWATLDDQELIQAFECLSPSKTQVGNAGDEIFYSSLELLRVKKYNFDTLETNKIITKLGNGKKVNFVLNLGAGLSVPNYHPFSFRPVISISTQPNSTKSLKDNPPTAYFDTSRPCPPFCGQES